MIHRPEISLTPTRWSPDDAPLPRNWLGEVREMPAVWLVELPADLEGVERFANVLTEEEHERAASFRRAEDRARSVLGRALVRYLLGAHLCLAPEAVPIVISPAGKPLLEPGAGSARVTPGFNLSH